MYYILFACDFNLEFATVLYMLPVSQEEGCSHQQTADRERYRRLSLVEWSRPDVREHLYVAIIRKEEGRPKSPDMQ